jgi:hypothetical protein
MLIGNVDGLIDGVISGWAFNEEEPDEHLIIRIMRGKQVIASGVANIMRKDLPDAGIGNGDHAFRIPAPESVKALNGLMIIAQSVSSGEAPLPITTDDERELEQTFITFAQRYEGVLVSFREEIDALGERMDAIDDQFEAQSSKAQTNLPDELAERLQKLESRMDSAEVFFMRIDQAVRQLVDEQKTKRKRFLGLF